MTRYIVTQSDWPAWYRVAYFSHELALAEMDKPGAKITVENSEDGTHWRVVPPVILEFEI
jgi:hypothetical protein